MDPVQRGSEPQERSAAGGTASAKALRWHVLLP